jgi:hypothetical protein
VIKESEVRSVIQNFKDIKNLHLAACPSNGRLRVGVPYQARPGVDQKAASL